MTQHSEDSFAAQPQEPPGRTDAMRPKPDHGETTYNADISHEGCTSG